MAVIQIKTPKVSPDIQTSLSQDYSSGTTLYVLASTGFVSGNYIVIGEPGNENSEIVALTGSPPDNVSLTISALKFSHARGTPVYYINWDKYELSYRTSSAGSWNIYASMPAGLNYDAQYTEYRDTAATSGYQWRYRYYSTEKSAYSDYSDVIGVAGWSQASVGYMIREIRKIVNDKEERTVTDIEIIRFLNAAQDVIFTLYDRWWFLFKDGTPIVTVSGEKKYALPTDFGRLKSVSFNYVSGGSDLTYNLRYVTMEEFDFMSRDNNAANDDNVRFYSIFPGDSSNATGYLKIWPKPDTAGFSITPRYYKTFTDLDTYGDTTEVPVPDILENFVISNILAIRKEDDKSDRYDKLFKQQIELLKRLQRKNVQSGRSLWKYQGQKGEEKLFGIRDINSDTTKELYW